MTGNHLIPTTIESGPQSGSTRVSLNPASRIQPLQSAPVKSKPACVSINMFRLMSKPNAFCRRSSSMIAFAHDQRATFRQCGVGLGNQLAFLLQTPVMQDVTLNNYIGRRQGVLEKVTWI